MACESIVDTYGYKRGETITFALRSDPVYDGTETVTCDVKFQAQRGRVPEESATVVLSIVPVFVPDDGTTPARWSFTITAAQSAVLQGDYATDAKVVYYNGSVDYPATLGLCIGGRVTA